MTSDRLVVLQLVANRWWTGSADPVIQLSRGLRERGHRVLLGLIRGDRFEDKARESGFSPIDGLSLEAKGNPLGIARDLRRLRELVQTESVDVVHAHHSHDHWLGWLCRGRAALVRSFHSARAVRQGWPSSALYRRTDASIAVSDEIQARCLSSGVAAERMAQVDGVTDVGRFAGGGGGDAIRKELALGSGPVLGCVARLAARRGHETLIRAFALVHERHPDARLLLIGKGELRQRLESLRHDLGLDEQVLMTGYRDTDLPAVLDAMDAFVLVGAGSDESCRAVLEAMAAARPVVARRVGALGQTVLPGVTGLLVDDERPESLARALETLVANPEQARMLGRAGQQRALSLFTPERHAGQVEAVYRQALARAGSRQGTRPG